MSAFTGMQLTKEEEPVLQAVDADIERYSKRLVRLRRRHNSFVRVNRLPPELLAEIFLHCQGKGWDLKPERSGTAMYRVTAPPLRWIFVTAVCNHWRQVALQTPRLWSHINLQYPQFAGYSLELAKRSPLYLETTRLNWSDISVLAGVVSNKRRRVGGIWWELECDRMHYREEPLSNKLSKVLSQFRHMHVASIYDMSHILLLFANLDFPAIQTLDLVNCVAQLPPCLLAPTLKTLSLAVTRNAKSTLHIPFVEFTGYLSRMSQLTLLELTGIGFGQEEGRVGSQISLPNLRKVVLESGDTHYKSYLSLLESLNLSPEVHLNLDFVGAENMSIEDLSSLLHILLQHVRPVELSTLTLRNDTRDFAIDLWEDIFDPVDLIVDYPFPPYTLLLPQCLQETKPLWKMLTHLVKLNCIKTILFSDYDQKLNIHRRMQRFLRACDDVTDLGFESVDNHSVFLKLLRQDRRGEDDSTPPPLAAPKLKMIYFSGVAWPRSSVQECPFDDLLSTLHNRAQAGHPLQEIVIRQCYNLTRTNIMDLHKKVDAVKPAMGMVKFTWDGHEEEYEEED